MQLHLLQSIYVPVKKVLSKAANCENIEDEILTSTISNIRKLSKVDKEKRLEVKNKMRNIAKEALVFTKVSSESNTEDHDYNSASADDCVTHDIVGFVLRKANQFTNCNTCIESLTTTMQGNVSKLTELKDFGNFLNYPSKELTKIFKEIESLLVYHFDANVVWGDMFETILGELENMCSSKCWMFN